MWSQGDSPRRIIASLPNAKVKRVSGTVRMPAKPGSPGGVKHPRKRCVGVGVGVPVPDTILPWKGNVAVVDLN